MRTAAFVRRADAASFDPETSSANASIVALMLTRSERAELQSIGALGECWIPASGMAERLADFKLVESGTRAWVLTPWGKLVAQAAKEGAQ